MAENPLYYITGNPSDYYDSSSDECNVLNAGFEIQYLLGNGLVQSVAQTIDIYVLKWGISQNDFAIGTAAGIFKSFVSIVLVVIANEIAKRTGDERLF